MSNKRIQKFKYQWIDGARYGIDANIVGEELARIQEQNGVTTPDAVVDAARPDDAPLHTVFEWRDEVAAESYRKWQARRVIKSVRVIYEETKEPQRVYVHVPTQQKDSLGLKTGGYQPVSVVVQRPDMYAMAISELQRKFNAARDGLESLKKAASEAPDTDAERMARIAIAVQAMQTASAAVLALH